jgi:hypothetical protein
MSYVECPKTNFRYLVMCYLRGNSIEDYSKFETAFDIASGEPLITKWEYEIAKPTLDYLFNDRYEVYKGTIKNMKFEEARESFRQSNYPWVGVIQKIHNHKDIEMICMQAIYPELFLPDVYLTKRII